ncbi:MAG TPA: hypothetical protein VJQ52_16335 [Steroidobacteraceae bacterium]|nr:hypothetical protein [Steroidobacteraceae bacterium]
MQSIKLGFLDLKNLWRSAACMLAVAGLSLGWSAVHASALGDTANAMQEGEWTVLSTNGFNDSILNINGTIFAYSEELKWDTQAGEMHFVGGYHYQPTAHIVYSEANNTWVSRPLSSSVFGQPFHSYDHMAINPAGRVMWVRPFGAGGTKLQRYDLDAKTWSSTASFSGGTQDAVGIEYFPDMNKVLYIDEGQTRLYDPVSNSWSTISGALAGLGPYHNIAEYSPVHKVMIMGGGNGSRALYRVNASGQITRLKDAPIEIGVTNSIVTVDPVGGNFLVFGRNKSFYEFDPIRDTWAPLAKPPFVDLTSDFPDIQGAAAGPVQRYGVIMVTKYDGNASKVYLYKHKHSDPVVAPKPPSNVTAE